MDSQAPSLSGSSGIIIVDAPSPALGVAASGSRVAEDSGTANPHPLAPSQHDNVLGLEPKQDSPRERQRWDDEERTCPEVDKWEADRREGMSQGEMVASSGGEAASVLREAEREVAARPQAPRSPSPSRARLVPPLTLRSQRNVNDFNMRRFTYANPSPPPPTYAPYSYSFVLPCRSLGPRIMGLSRQILQGIKRDTGACEVQVLFREDGLCYVVATGSVGAIVRTLAAVRDLLFTHTKLTLAERDALAAAGTAWCEFNEHNLEAVDGYWLRDAYADRGGDGNRARVQRAHVETSEWRRGEVDWRRDDARSQPWPQERHPSTWHRTNYVERARARDDRRHNDSPRAGPSQPGPLRPSSRSRSPGRDSRHSSVPERPGRRPVDSPAPSYESRRVESRPSKHAKKVSPHDFERQSARERTPTGQASNSELDMPAEEDVEERLEIPIPLTAIPLFLGPNASGHFIAQTTAVRLSVKADLEGATLWLERDSGKGGGDSLLEARLLVEKVLASHERAGGSPQAVRAPAREARAHDWNEVGAKRSSTRRQDDSSPARKASQDDRKGGERAREVGDRRAGGPRRRSRSRSRSRGEDARDDRWKAKRDRGTDSDRRDSGWNEGTRGAAEVCGWRREDATSASPVQRRRYRSRSRSPARDGGRGRA